MFLDFHEYISKWHRRNAEGSMKPSGYLARYAALEQARRIAVEVKRVGVYHRLCERAVVHEYARVAVAERSAVAYGANGSGCIRA